MRPRLSENEKRNKQLIFRVSKEDKIWIKSQSKKEKYPSMSDFIRTLLLSPSDNVISLDEEVFTGLKRMDYELNRAGVNLNKIAEKVNNHKVSQFTSDDGEVLEQALQEHQKCSCLLNKYLEKIESNKLFKFNSDQKET